MPIKIEIVAETVHEYHALLALLSPNSVNAVDGVMLPLTLVSDAPEPLDNALSEQQSATHEPAPEAAPAPSRKRSVKAKNPEPTPEPTPDPATPAVPEEEPSSASEPEGDDENETRNRIVEGMTKLFMTKDALALEAIAGFKAKHKVKMMRELDVAAFPDALDFIAEWSAKASV